MSVDRSQLPGSEAPNKINSIAFDQTHASRPSDDRRTSTTLATKHNSGSTDTLSSTLSHCTTSNEEQEAQHAFSAFYCHPTTRYSIEQQRSESKIRLDVYNVELERGLGFQSTDRLQDESVWPAKQTLQEKALLAKKQRGCAPLRNLSKKQRFWVMMLIGLVVVAAAVGLGVGISRAVGGGVWAGDDQTVKIPN